MGILPELLLYGLAFNKKNCIKLIQTSGDTSSPVNGLVQIVISNFLQISRWHENAVQVERPHQTEEALTGEAEEIVVLKEAEEIEKGLDQDPARGEKGETKSVAEIEEVSQAI